jgi:pimeloyl-ACP methyl ester carboxylesterase
LTTEIFDLGDIQIEAIINGTGEIIILLAAGSQDASTFDDFTPILNKAGYKTVAINRRGFAGSKGPLEDLTMHDLANDVAGVVRELGENAVHVLGWAFGNRVARCFAVDHPHLVKTIILLAAGGRVPMNTEGLKYDSIVKSPNHSREERLEAVKMLYFSPSTDTNTILHALKRPENRQEHEKANLAHNRANKATPVMDWWDAGKAPMLVIQGLDDQSALPENGRILKRDHGERVKLVNLENLGHFMIHQDPGKIAKEIILYLSNFK